MPHARPPFVFLLAVILPLVLSCADRASTGQGRIGDVEVEVSLVKTSLTPTLAGVSLCVTRNGAVVHTDTTMIVGGAFQFRGFSLDAGVAVLRVDAFDEEQHVLYTGADTVMVQSGLTTRVALVLTPCVPMVRLAPYQCHVGVGDTTASTLELRNISRYILGIYNVTFDTNLLAFQDIRLCGDPRWGTFALVTPVLSPRTTLRFVVLRIPPGPSDEVPSGLCDLVTLRFIALAPGETRLVLEVSELTDNDGYIREWDDLHCDHQTVTIGPGTGNQPI